MLWGSEIDLLIVGFHNTLLRENAAKEENMLILSDRFKNLNANRLSAAEKASLKVKQQDPVVPLRAVYYAPKRRYMATQTLRHPLRTTFILDERDKHPVPAQTVVVVQRTPFAGSWMLLLLVGKDLRWEHELDVKLWKRLS